MRKKLPIVLQVAMINYSLFVTGAYLTSPTNASFNDIEKINASVHVEWDWEEDDDGTWDKSSLKAIGAGRDGEGNIYATFINTGSDMRGPVIYELYWTEKGNPKPEKGGVLLTEGEIPALQTNEEYTIYFTPTLLGNYMFKAYHRPGHPGKGELWSDAISVTFLNNVQIQPPIPEVPVGGGGGGPAAGLPNVEEEEIVLPEEDKESKEESGLPDGGPGDVEGSDPGVDDGDVEGSDPGVNDGDVEGSDPGVDDGDTEDSDTGTDDGDTGDSDTGTDHGDTGHSDTGADDGDSVEN